MKLIKMNVAECFAASNAELAALLIPCRDMALNSRSYWDRRLAAIDEALSRLGKRPQYIAGFCYLVAQQRLVRCVAVASVLSLCRLLILSVCTRAGHPCLPPVCMD